MRNIPVTNTTVRFSPEDEVLLTKRSFRLMLRLSLTKKKSAEIFCTKIRALCITYHMSTKFHEICVPLVCYSISLTLSSSAILPDNKCTVSRARKCSVTILRHFSQFFDYNSCQKNNIEMSQWTKRKDRAESADFILLPNQLILDSRARHIHTYRA